MKGLRTHESSKFEVFFELVQKKAMQEAKVFFLDSGDGEEFENDTMEGENLQGWLIPFAMADEFEEIWEKHEEDDEWVDFFMWVEWFEKNNEIDIKFVKE